MKYKPEDYLDTGFYSDCEELEHKKEKVVKCRKPHKCASCQSEIKQGNHALYESGFLDGHPVSCYTCLFCIEEWLAESGQIEFEIEVTE